MLACKFGYALVTTSDIEMEHYGAESRCCLAQQECKARS